MPEQIQEPPTGTISAETHDLTIVRMLIADMVKGLNAGPKTRARSLVVTKLEEASMWAVEGLKTE